MDKIPLKISIVFDDYLMTREEAIKVASETYGWLKTDREREALETLIPELAESEDERIRKALIDALKVSETVGELKFRLPEPTREDAIAYLEKQKEQKPSINIDQLKSLMLQYLQEAANEKDDSNIEADTDKWARKILGYDFEQKEQKEIFDVDKFFAGRDVNDFKKELFLVIRGARELKPTDEEIWHNIENQIAPWLVDILQEGVESVEPKFKVGDKVKLASEPKYPAREIVEIKDGAYYFDSAVHLPFARQDEWELVEQKEQDKCPEYCVRSHCIGCPIYEKKEEQWRSIFPPGLGEVRWNPISSVQQKPAEWSEEDEEMLNSCISSIEESKENRYAYKETDGDTSYDREIAFMKSLPERFVLQPKQEWSDEDESNATFILESLDGLLRYCKKNKEGAHQSKQIKDAQEWIKTRLKSIKPQLETNDEEYIRNLENLESVVYYAKSLPDDTRTKLGNFLQSLRKNRKTCGVDEFSLTLRNCLSTDSELTDEQADTFARAYGEDLYKVALGEMKTGLDKEDIEEYRNEFNPKPNEIFWVRCKTDKSENMWFDKGDERPAHAILGNDGLIYLVCVNESGDGNHVYYQDKDKFLETFEIIEKPE